jgi:hypothetical protein
MDILQNLSICSSPNEKNTECSPLLTVREVLEWSDEKACSWPVRPLAPRSDFCSVGTSQHCHQTLHRPTRLVDRHSVPRTLVCHDKQGGYLDDRCLFEEQNIVSEIAHTKITEPHLIFRFVYGSDKHTEYRFFHWAGIDIFVYFSHKFVTICPPVWVNAAHLHGVQILGITFLYFTCRTKFYT